MSIEQEITTNWFNKGGKEYAKYRPVYPDDLAAYLASICVEKKAALDIGCGSGQLARLLTSYFQSVTGIDSSQDQINNANQNDGVNYICAPAESLPRLSPVNLISVAQAAHWLDLESFYQEIIKVAAPNCILALICYGTVSLTGGLDNLFNSFYRDQIYKFWTFDRSLVDQGYSQIQLPFSELPSKKFTISYDWNYLEFMGYISTWSAVKNAINNGHADIVDNFAVDLAKLWGDQHLKNTVTWPIHIRLARLND